MDIEQDKANHSQGGTILGLAVMPADVKLKKGTPDRKVLMRRINHMVEVRRLYEDRWKSIRDYQLPFIGQFEDTDDSTNPGRRKDRKIAQGSAFASAQVFGAGIESGLTPPSRQWFKFEFSNSELNKNVDILKILDQRQEITASTLAKSNFYNSVHSCYLELAFGQCPLAIFADNKTGIRFTALTIGTYYLDVDGYGKVNALARKMELTMPQIIDNFGIEALPERLRSQIENGQMDYHRKKKVYWLVYPNDAAVKDRLDSLNMPFKSVYWLEDSKQDEYLYVGGFHEFPAPAARYMVNGLEPYAKGPGWFAEGDSKALQVMKKDYLTALELSIKPPMQGDPALMTKGVNLMPGGFTPMTPDASGRGLVPVFNVGTNLAAVSQEILATEDRIKKAYNADLFLMLNQLDPAKMTASEVQARLNESLRMLGPVTERLQDEFLTLIIERVYNILDRAGFFPPIPEDMQELLGEDIKITYISPLAQAQKMSGLTSIEQAIGFVMQMAQAWPDSIKAVDPVGTVNTYMDLLGAPANMRRSEEEVKDMIEQEQKLMQQVQQEQKAQQIAQALPDITSAAKNATEAANDGNPALQQMLGMGSV